MLAARHEHLLCESRVKAPNDAVAHGSDARVRNDVGQLLRHVVFVVHVVHSRPVAYGAALSRPMVLGMVSRGASNDTEVVGSDEQVCDA